VRRVTVTGEAGVGAAGGALDAPSEARIQRARGSGARLDDEVRRTMEDHLGADLSSVRVHTGATADELGSRINARAFTVGRDVFFRQGEYQPATRSGQRLLAHELTHVVQQGAGAVRRDVVRRDSVASGADFNKLAKVARAITFEHDNTGFQADKTTLLVPKTAADILTKLFGKPVNSPVLTLTTGIDHVGRFDIVIANPANQSKSCTITVHVANTETEAAAEAAEAVDITGCYEILTRAATAVAPEIKVYLEHHQNKHQHKNSMIGELGVWKSKKGTTFKAGKGLAWHRANTAVTARDWAASLGLADGEARVAKKAPMADGYIYDVKAMRAGGRINVTYHCNPVSDE
jgi:hypothetical protein